MADADVTMKQYNAISILSDHIETPLGTMLLLARDGAMIGLEFDDHPERVARDLRLRYGTRNAFRRIIPTAFQTVSAPISPATLKPSRGFSTDGGGTEFQRKVWEH